MTECSPKRLRMTKVQQDTDNNELPANNSETFESVVRSDVFVDKTPLIRSLFYKDTIESDGSITSIERQYGAVMITAPRRFGKTVNMDMVQRFLELQVNNETGEKETKKDLEKESVDDTSNYKLFSETPKTKLKIMHHEEFVSAYFGKYPIIKASFSGTRLIKSRHGELDELKRIVHETFKKHEYLGKSTILEDEEKEICNKWCTDPDYKTFDSCNVIQSLKLLSEYLKKYFQRKVFVLIDDFESIILRAILGSTNSNSYGFGVIVRTSIELVNKVFDFNSDTIAGGFLTAVLKFKYYDWKLNKYCVKQYKFSEDHSYADYYGFTTEEVTALFQKWSISEDLQEKAISKYNGYRTLSGGRIYNPYSIVKFLQTRKLENYWHDSTSIVNLKDIFNNCKGVRHEIQLLLENKSSSCSVLDTINQDGMAELHKVARNSKDQDRSTSTFIINFLLKQGYFTYSTWNEELTIPNDEIREVFCTMLANHLISKNGLNENVHRKCQGLLQLLVSCIDKDKAIFRGILKQFQEELGNLVKSACVSLYTSSKSAMLHAVRSVALKVGYNCIDKFYSRSEGWTILIHKDNFGVVVLLKWDSDEKKTCSIDALQEIFTLGYYSAFSNARQFPNCKITPCILIGLHLNSEKKVSVHSLRKKEISEILNRLQIANCETMEQRVAVACESEEHIPVFIENALCVS